MLVLSTEARYSISMMDWLYAIILGVIQGITEFLPVSSSAHLIVSSWFTGKDLPLVLNVSLHFGTVLALSLIHI